MRRLFKHRSSAQRGLSLVVVFLLLMMLTIAAAMPIGIAPLAGDGASNAAAAPAGFTEVWENVSPEGISSLTVCEIEAANQNTAYAIIDNSPGKVIKTTDYGNSWSTIDLVMPDGNPFGWTQQISVVTDQIVWVGSVHTPGFGLAITTDGGGNWAYVGGQSYQAAVEATSSVHAWTGGNFPGGGGAFIRETPDAGAHWTHVWGTNPGSCSDISSTGAGNAWAVGNGYYVGWITHCDGTSWTVKTPSPTPPELKGCCTVDPNTAWAVGSSTILRTIDGGATWESHTAPAGTGSLMDVTALDANTAYAVGNSGTIIRTTDGGATWTPMRSGTSANLTSVYAIDDTHVWAVGASGTVLRLVLVPNNTPAGSDVDVDLGNGRNISFANVTGEGLTTATPQSDPSLLGLWESVPGSCVDIITTATYSGKMQVTLHYDEGTLTRDESSLLLLHCPPGDWWQDISTSLDTVNNIITGETDSLSPFVIASPTLMEGDVNGDGYVTLSDSTFIRQHLLGLRTLNVDQLISADTNDDGKVSLSDSTHIRQWLLDSDGHLGILYKPLWQSPADDRMNWPEPRP